MCKKQTSLSHSSTESDTISLDAGLRIDGLLALDLWDIVVEVVRSTNSKAQPTIIASRKLVRLSIPKPRTRMSKEDKRLSNWVMWSMHPQTHILLKVSLSCSIFEDNEAVIKMIIK